MTISRKDADPRSRAAVPEAAPVQDEPGEHVAGTLSREQVLAVMTRAGYTKDEVSDAATALPELVDRVKDCEVLARFALTRGQLMDRMGSSP